MMMMVVVVVVGDILLPRQAPACWLIRCCLGGCSVAEQLLFVATDSETSENGDGGKGGGVERRTKH